MKALYIQARTTPYSELIFSSILLYWSLAVGYRTFLKVPGVARGVCLEQVFPGVNNISPL